MEPERWRQIDQLFHLVLGKPRDERELLLADLCAGDAGLQKEVEDLVLSHEQAEEFIESPASDLAAEVLGKGQAGLKFGDKIGPYEIQSVLGIGGMGEVYLASDTRLGRQVALKILPPRFTLDPERVSRFEKEARAASALNHPNIVTIHEIGHFNNARFIVTEFVEGHTLRQLINEKPFTLNEALNVTIQVAVALTSAHTAGIVHRDIKPENIMLRADGYVKILDFGLAKLTETGTSGSDPETPTLLQSNPGVLMGTVQYMSPEQAQRKHVDLRTDVWSLGIVLYELLAGNVPFSGKTPSHVMVSIMEDELPALTSRANVPAELDRVVTKALRKNKRERYQTAQALGHDLKELKRELQLQDRLKPLVETDEHLRDQPTKRDGQIAIDGVAASTNTADTGITHPTMSLGLPEVIPSITDGAEEAHHATSWRLRYWLVAAFVIVLFTTLFYVWRKAYSPNAAPIRSIAVMPFVNKSGDAELEYLSDGMTDTLIARLSDLPNLDVQAQSSVFHYKGKETDTRTIGKELNVDAILNSSVVQRGDDLILYLELVDARSGSRLWGNQYNRKRRDLVSLLAEIARDVSNKLKIKLSGADQRKLAKNYTENAEAYALFLKGRFHLRKRTEPEIKKGIAFMQEAIAADPFYALAYAGLGEAYLALALAAEVKPSEVWPKAKAANQKAIEIDDTLAEGHSGSGSTLWWYDWSWKEAEIEFQRALALNPNSSMAHFGYGDFLGRMGRKEEGVAEKKRARDLEPRDPMLTGAAAFAATDPDKGLELVRAALDADPNYYFAYMAKGAIYRKKKMYPESIAAYQRAKELAPDQTWSDAILAGTFVEAGQPNEARAILNQMLRLRKSRWVPPYNIALVYRTLGETDKAVAWLEKGYEERDPKMTFLKDKAWDNLSGDPRFAALMERMHFPE
jgi:eukaryotic-like serine/threonine-protein kinase